MSKGKDISTMFTKEENKKNGRLGYGLATREKKDVISPAQYGAFLQKRGRGKCVLDKEAEAIPDWCPLMDLPEKDNGDYPANASDAGFVEGWNQCIDEITGG